jgi:surfeit locus 1 family protein
VLFAQARLFYRIFQMTGFFSGNFRKPQLIPLLFIIAATITLAGLGIWQLERLHWKNNILKEVEQAQLMPPLQNLPQNIAGLEYRKVILRGVFNHEKSLHMIGRQRGNFPGYFIVTPFTLENDGRIILVNRGFSPVGKESRPDGVQTIEGVIRPPRTKRFFAPENMPQKNVWFYENIAAISNATGLKLSPVIIEQVGKEQTGVFPIPGDGKINLQNNHLGYAITWFATALIGIVMFAFYHRKVRIS